MTVDSFSANSGHFLRQPTRGGGPWGMPRAFAGSLFAVPDNPPAGAAHTDPSKKRTDTWKDQAYESLSRLSPSGSSVCSFIDSRRMPFRFQQSEPAGCRISGSVRAAGAAVARAYRRTRVAGAGRQHRSGARASTSAGGYQSPRGDRNPGSARSGSELERQPAGRNLPSD